MYKAWGCWLGSIIWSGINGAVRFAARKRWLKSRDLGCRVISVGNLQVGGAGKTPLVAQIAKEAVERGLIPVILSRGYRSEWERVGGVVEPGSGPALPRVCGDEPALLHDQVSEAWIGVGAQREEAFQRILRRIAPADRNQVVAILDDGFQNWRIRKDVELVALTDRTRFQVLFRENQRALRFADLVVWTKGKTRPDAQGRPMARVEFRVPRVMDRRVWLVTGVADGNSVFEAARQQGYRIERHIAFADHSTYSVEEARRIIGESRNQGCEVVLTSKDWVKWRELGIGSSQVVVLELELAWLEGREIWNRIIWGE